MLSPIIIFINESAGAGEHHDFVSQLEVTFRKAGVDARLVKPESGTDISEAVLRAVQERPQAIVAGGGDGTINTVATALVGTDIVLGVLPMGTLNHFAKDLKIPLDLDEAVRTIIAAHTVKVDVGKVNERYFLNNSSLGIYPRIVRYREYQQRSGRSKWVAFFWSVIAVLRRHVFLGLRLVANGEKSIRRTPFVFIGNNEYQMEGFNIGTRQRINAGQLSVYSVNHAGRWGLFKLALRSLFGQLNQAKDFDAFCTPDVLIESRHKQLLASTDGEVNMMKTPLHYEVQPGALQVIVPQGEAGQDCGS
jgi:diacylglycerol kinase family enzyme